MIHQAKLLQHLLLTAFIMALATTWVHAQTQGQYIRKGDEKFEAGDYGSALYYYDTVYQMRKSELDLGFKIAEAARLYKAFLAAEPAYKHVVNHKKGLNKYPLASFWLADVQRSLGKYDSAIIHYDMFLKAQSEDVEARYFEKAKRNRQNCYWAMEQLKGNYQQLVYQHLEGDQVNTARKELAPYWDGEKLYFSSLRFRDKEQDIRAKPYAQILLFKDSLTQVADSISVPRKFSSHTAFSHDNQRTYFTICSYVKDRYEIKCQIYFRKRDASGVWGSPVRMSNAVNLPEYTTTQPAIGYDKATGEETLYFASDRPNSKGKLDIWAIQLDTLGNGKGDALNLQTLNTVEDDMTPYYDGYFDILYFSSEGHKNMGGFDLFETEFENGQWTEPVNLGPSINTSYDETHFTVDKTGNLAHYASNHLDRVVHDTSGRVEWRSCCSDLFSVELDKFIYFKPIAYCDGNIDSINWTIRAENKPGQQPQIEVDENDPNKKYYMLELEDVYHFTASKAGYFPDSFSYSTVDKQGGIYDSSSVRLFPQITFTATLINKLSKEPVTDAIVVLTDASGKAYAPQKVGNDYIFVLRPDQKLKLQIGGENIAPRKLDVDIPAVCTPLSITKEIAVLPDKLRLPLFLYFDNDQPNPRTTQTTTEKTYEETYLQYIARRQEFIQQMTKPILETQEALPDSAILVVDSLAAEIESLTVEVDSFFTHQLKGGFNKLEGFADELIKYLEAMEEDQRITISIRGFASPLASGEYNKRLTNRRISSVRNYFNAYYGDRLDRFIDNNKLIIKEVSFGESNASKDVGDSRSDERSSIYSVKASRERRVEIIDIAAD